MGRPVGQRQRRRLVERDRLRHRSSWVAGTRTRSARPPSATSPIMPNRAPSRKTGSIRTRSPGRQAVTSGRTRPPDRQCRTHHHRERNPDPRHSPAGEDVVVVERRRRDPDHHVARARHRIGIVGPERELAPISMPHRHHCPHARIPVEEPNCRPRHSPSKGGRGAVAPKHPAGAPGARRPDRFVNPAAAAAPIFSGLGRSARRPRFRRFASAAEAASRRPPRGSGSGSGRAEPQPSQSRAIGSRDSSPFPTIGCG